MTKRVQTEIVKTLLFMGLFVFLVLSAVGLLTSPAVADLAGARGDFLRMAIAAAPVVFIVLASLFCARKAQ